VGGETINSLAFNVEEEWVGIIFLKDNAVNNFKRICRRVSGVRGTGRSAKVICGRQFYLLTATLAEAKVPPPLFFPLTI
jgi:hypothetical protein